MSQQQIEQMLNQLHGWEEIRSNGVAQIRDEFAMNGMGHIVPKILDLNCSSDALAKAIGLAFSMPTYPWDLKPSEIPEGALAPAAPDIDEHGDGFVFCKNGVLYFINPLDTDKLKKVAGRLQTRGIKRYGVISRAQWTTLGGDRDDDAAPVTADNTAEKRALNELLATAIRHDASDIHFEPQKDDVRVRFRVDSQMKDIKRFDHEQFKRVANIILSRCKGGKAGSYIQAFDGMFVHEVPPNRRVKMRVMMIPVTVPERQDELPCFCLRILGNRLEQRKLAELGIPNTARNPQLTRLRLLTERKNGLILVSGPTGSGKTTTLTAVLAEMQRSHPNRCRYTAEDPVEMNLVGVNHVQINEAADLDFARAVKSFLRGDPDEVLIGEIRDRKVAEQALTASITGHLVFSTIHTNSSIETVSRLIDMGCDAYVVASALKAATAQRLVRKVCPHCSTKARWGSLTDGSHPVLKDSENTLMRIRYEHAVKAYSDLDDYPESPDVEVPIAGPGCSGCGNSGYKGRLLVTELFEVSPRIQDLIAARESVFRLRRQAIKEGFKEMWEHGAIEIFKRKNTTFDEMIAALGEREESLKSVAAATPDPVLES